MKSSITKPYLGLIFIALLSISCEYSPVTVAMHAPIYPAANESVEYTIERVTSGTVISAKLFESVRTINSLGTVLSTTPEVELQSWTSPSGDLSYTKAAGYAANALVNYRWEIIVEDDDGYSKSKSYNVTYSIRPYPIADAPAPVYLQGDVDDVFDVVFIPDTDVTSLSTFRDHCRLMIRESFFDEPTTRLWRKQFNFYINPERGTATDYDDIATDGTHQVPSNNAQISFAEGRCLMHQNNLRDYASGGLFSTEMQNRGTVLHEAGHSLFGLADEYAGGVHWEDPDFGNTWDSLTEAQDASDNYGDCKDLSDVNTFDGIWRKLCIEACQMKTTGLTHTTYDCPCANHILSEVFKKAGN